MTIKITENTEIQVDITHLDNNTIICCILSGESHVCFWANYSGTLEWQVDMISENLCNGLNVKC